MSSAFAETEAGGVQPSATVRVWDPFVRMFHWSLVAFYAIAWATAENFTRAHVWVGYGIAALLAFRVVWGFVGPRHARFSDFVRSPRDTFAYLRAMGVGRSPRFIGHNPAGGAMIVVMIAALAATGLTGWLMVGPLWGREWIEEIHKLLADATLVLVGLHLTGVLVSSIAHGENLVRAMITGQKRAGEPGRKM